MPKFVHDQRTGAGYGFTGRKGFQTEPTKSADTFPYTQEESPEEDLGDEILDLKARINKKLSYGNLGRPPEPYSRTDRFTLSKNRLNLAEAESHISILQGIVPFPMRGFDGPALGGTSSNPAYTVSPGRIDGSPYGWTKGVLSPMIDTPDAPSRFLDAIDPDVRARVGKKLKIARIK